MEGLYFYLEDCNGGFIVDEEYMENDYDPHYEKLIFSGTIDEITDYISWLCNDNE